MIFTHVPLPVPCEMLYVFLSADGADSNRYRQTKRDLETNFRAMHMGALRFLVEASSFGRANAIESIHAHGLRLAPHAFTRPRFSFPHASAY